MTNKNKGLHTPYILYGAYGSNLNKAQMAKRCPDALPIGTAYLHNYELVFKGVLDIEKKKGGIVPLGLWHISESDLMELDYYEGYPYLYTRKKIKIKTPQGWIKVLIYIMNEETHFPTPPCSKYKDTCTQGYHNFGLTSDIKYLDQAERKSWNTYILKNKGGKYEKGI